MAKINDSCDINATALGKHVIEVSAIYNNKFIRRLYIGHTLEKAKKIFMDKLTKGEIK